MIVYQCDRCGDTKPPTRTMGVAITMLDASTRVMADPPDQTMHLCVTCVEKVLAFINN